jgi:hypothetical protein
MLSQEEDTMKTVHSLLVAAVVGIAAASAVSAAQSDRASENISVLRAQKIELVDALLLANVSH